jgi:hypothetical protein
MDNPSGRNVHLSLYIFCLLFGCMDWASKIALGIGWMVIFSDNVSLYTDITIILQEGIRITCSCLYPKTAHSLELPNSSSPNELPSLQLSMFLVNLTILVTQRTFPTFLWFQCRGKVSRVSDYGSRRKVRPGMGKLRPAGQVRPVERLNAARGRSRKC